MTDQRPDLLEGTGRAGPTLYQRWGMGKHMCASPAVCFLSFTATARRLTVAPGGDLDRKSREARGLRVPFPGAASCQTRQPLGRVVGSLPTLQEPAPPPMYHCPGGVPWI